MYSETIFAPRSCIANELLNYWPEDGFIYDTRTPTHNTFRQGGSLRDIWLPSNVHIKVCLWGCVHSTYAARGEGGQAIVIIFIAVQGGWGGQKRPKTCIRTMYTAAYIIFSKELCNWTDSEMICLFCATGHTLSMTAFLAYFDPLPPWLQNDVIITKYQDITVTYTESNSLPPPPSL